MAMLNNQREIPWLSVDVPLKITLRSIHEIDHESTMKSVSRSDYLKAPLWAAAHSRSRLTKVTRRATVTRAGTGHSKLGGSCWEKNRIGSVHFWGQNGMVCEIL